jgi:hypothetical protein
MAVRFITGTTENREVNDGLSEGESTITVDTVIANSILNSVAEVTPSGIVEQGEGQLSASVNICINLTAISVVTLPPVVVGRDVKVTNTSTIDSLIIYPTIGDSLGNGGFGDPATLMAGDSVTFFADTALVYSTNIINHKVINIGPWNMDTGGSEEIIAVPHTFGAGWIQVRSIVVSILENPTETAVYMLGSDGESGVRFMDNTAITLGAGVGGTFDDPNFSGTGQNRGYINIAYSVI